LSQEDVERLFHSVISTSAGSNISHLDGLSRKLAWSTLNLREYSSQLYTLQRQFLISLGIPLARPLCCPVDTSTKNTYSIIFLLKWKPTVCPEYRTYIYWIRAFMLLGYNVKLILIDSSRSQASKAEIASVKVRLFTDVPASSIEYAFVSNSIPALVHFAEYINTSLFRYVFFCNDSTNKLSQPYSLLRHLLHPVVMIFGLSTIISTGSSVNSLYFGGDHHTHLQRCEFSEEFIGLPYGGYLLSAPSMQHDPLNGSSSAPNAKIARLGSYYAVCGSNINKINRATLQIWKEITNPRTPIVMYPFPPHYNFHIESSIDELNVLASSYDLNLVIINRSLSTSEISALLDSASFALDTFPYPGVATAFDYVSHKLPLVSLLPSNLLLRNMQAVDLYRYNSCPVFTHENQFQAYRASLLPKTQMIPEAVKLVQLASQISLAL
jgi:hypothetical protein